VRFPEREDTGLLPISFLLSPTTSITLYYGS
jgi:hypothetical protein